MRIRGLNNTVWQQRESNLSGFCAQTENGTAMAHSPPNILSTVPGRCSLAADSSRSRWFLEEISVGSAKGRSKWIDFIV
jgi:hypothetical protein